MGISKYKLVFVCLCLILLSGCAYRVVESPDPSALDTRSLPQPDVSVIIPGLGPCNDNSDRTLTLSSQHPVTILVHGCFGSAGRYRVLAQVFAFHGQQTACFSYDDRKSLMVSSGQLAVSVNALASELRNPDITVIGHSQGGLIARKALVAEGADPIRGAVAVRLVTISAPFAGIAAARMCAFPAMRMATLGINDLICWAISGDKWHEITYASSFIQQPGDLHARVSRHIRIATDETGSCREWGNDGECARDDYIFSLAEQLHPQVDQASGVTAVEVKAGHVEVVGKAGVSPEKLISVLQREGVMRPTEPERASRFRNLLARLYGN